MVTHINHALVPRTHPPMYLTHKYWARKPHNVVADYIEHYSKEGEIVLDGFAGSGVTLFEAVRLGRRAVGFDLDPLSILTMKATIQTTDTTALDHAFEAIKADVRETIEKLYNFECPICHKQGITRYVVWSYVVNCPTCRERILMAEARRPKGKQQNIYKCPHCKQDFSYANVPIVGEEPIFLQVSCLHCQRTSKVSNPKLKPVRVQLDTVWYPKIRFFYNGDRPFGTKRRAGDIEELYTARNLYALALLYDEISRIEDKISKQAMLYVFSSMVPQASRLVPWRGGFVTGGPAWTVPEYLILPVHCEFDVWSRFENRFHSMKRGVENRNERIPSNLICAKSFEQLLNNQDHYYIERVNSIELTQRVPPNSVDYVFTDPPYGGAIQYFELDLIRVAWILGKQYSDIVDQWWKEEVTINRGQNKDFEYYHRMLSTSFGQIYKVLKPNHFLTVTFHSTDIDVWNSIISAIKMAGFELEKIIYQPPAVRSAKASLQPYGSAVGDYYIRFRKPERKKEVTEEQTSKEKYFRVVIETTKKIIAERGEPTPFTFILNGIIPELDKQGVFFVDKRGSKGIEEVLKNRLNIDFVLKPIPDKKGKPVGVGWWFKDPSTIPYLESTPLRERVEKLVINILNDKVKVTFDDVLQEIFIRFPNALTPNTQSVREVLEEYATKTPDKKWMLKPKYKMRVKEHDVIVKNLAELGKHLGYEVHADIDGYRQASFPFQAVNQNRLKKIDVIYYSKNNANAIFEVENTTGISEAIIRGSNILSQNLLRVIVIPDERKRFLRARIHEPILKEEIEKYNWYMITYDELSDFLNEKPSKQTVQALSNRLVRLSDFKLQDQSSMQKFLS
ncbi:MAG: DNA methyltransferase [Candidatus Bathyarchaeia archaeon]